MALLGHVLKRLLLVALAYMVALIVSLVAMATVYAALSSMPDAPDYFSVMAISPYVALAAPAVGFFVLMLAIVLTAAQTLVTALISEIFSLRAAWVHILFGAIVSYSAYLLVVPVAGEFRIMATSLEAAVFAVSGAVGGLVYWLIAGRQAGFRRPLPPAPLA